MARKRARRGVEAPDPTELVCSIGYVCKRWNYARSSVLYAIDRGHIRAAKIGRDWIVSIPSLLSHWGDPDSRTRPTADKKTPLC